MKQKKEPVIVPKDSAQAKVALKKAEQALAIRQNASQARAGKPLAFPTHWLRP